MIFSYSFDIGIDGEGVLPELLVNILLSFGIRDKTIDLLPFLLVFLHISNYYKDSSLLNAIDHEVCPEI